MAKYNHLMIDLETLAIDQDATVVNISLLPFNLDEKGVTFEQLLERGQLLKLSLKEQEGKRTIDEKTVTWWKEQGEEVAKQLESSDEDLTLEQASQKIDALIKEWGIDTQFVKGWCRGTDFDFPIIKSLLTQVWGEQAIFHMPCRFYNQRDVRTALDAYADIAGQKIILDEKYIKGFLKHNSLHDCAKAIIELRYARSLTANAHK